MFGLFKNFFKKSEPAAAPAAPESPTPAPPPPAPKPAPAPPPPPPAPAAQPRPVPQKPVQAAPPAPSPAAAPAVSGPAIPISLASIVAKFPDNLKPLVGKTPGGNVSAQVPLDLILPKLSTGAVKITYSQLLGIVPNGYLNGGDGVDSTLVEIPLSEILPKLKPEQLPRRQGQRMVEVPDDIQPLFGTKGQPLPKAQSAAVPQQPRPAPAQPQPTPAPAPAPVSSTPEPRPVAPAAPPAPAPVATPPPPAPKPAPAAQAPAPQPAPEAAPEPPPQPIRPAMGLPDPAALRPAQAMPTKPVGTGPAQAPSIPKPAPLPTVKPTPPPAPAPLPKPAAQTPPAPAPATAPSPSAGTTEGSITVTISQVSGAWPEAVREANASQAASQLEIPLKAIEDGIKKGRVQVKGATLKSWIKGGQLEVSDDADLDLPVPVLVPLFLSKRGPAKVQKKLVVGDNIPDVFAGKNIPQPTAEAPAATPPPAPQPAAPPAPAPAKPAAPAPPSLAAIFQQPGKTSWNPAEIVQKICTLKGISGAVVTTSDGLLVAGQVPAPLKGEMIAGFVPEMFNRINQYSKEVKIGEIQQLSFAAGVVNCRVFHREKVYLALLCAPDASLPDLTLELVLKELGRQPGK